MPSANEVNELNPYQTSEKPRAWLRPRWDDLLCPARLGWETGGKGLGCSPGERSPHNGVFSLLLTEKGVSVVRLQMIWKGGDCGGAADVPTGITRSRSDGRAGCTTTPTLRVL